MIEPQRVQLFCCRTTRARECSHHLLLAAAAGYAPTLRDTSLGIGAHGKPYFLHAPQIQFNLSHSGCYWLCAFSELPVGIDVQEHRSCRKEALAQRFFAPAEHTFLQKTGYDAFFDLWCAKESYLKFTGAGLSGLKDTVVVTADGQFPAVPDATLRLLPLADGYSLCVCTGGPADIRMQMLYTG